MKRLFVLTAGLLLVLVSGTAVWAGDNNGQSIGQDPVRLAITRCSDAGDDNGGEYQNGVTVPDWGKVAIHSDCLAKVWPQRYSLLEWQGMLAQAGCEYQQNGYVYWTCEVDPGNSAAHNQSPEGITVAE